MWDGVRNFWCRGKLQTGPDSRNLVIVTLLVNVINALSLGFSWVDYADVERNYFHLLFGLGLWIVIDYMLFKAATTDPGMIPKQPDDEHSLKWRALFKNYLMVDGLKG